MHIFNKKKGFSLLEMIIVIAIISVLLVAFRATFQAKNKELIDAQTCANYLHAHMQNFLMAGLRNKGIVINNERIHPEYYTIGILPSKNSIETYYSTGESKTGGVAQSGFSLTGFFQCVSKNYPLVLSGTDTYIVINKGGQSTNEQIAAMTILPGKISTKIIDIMQCNNAYTTCKKVGEFGIDTRTQDITRKMCESLATDDITCEEWSE